MARTNPTAIQLAGIDAGVVELAADRNPRWPDWLSGLIAMGMFAGLSLSAAVASRAFQEADACTHYLYARFALRANQHFLLTDVWGRPFCTAIYSIPALIGGRLGVRAMSMLLALSIAMISMRIAQKQGYRRPVLALIFVLAQPVLFLHSFSELTELPFAFLVALGFWAYQSKQWLAMALLAGLMPTARPEGFGFLLLAAAALLLHRKWFWLPVLMLPLAVWSVGGWTQFGMVQPWYVKIPRWLMEKWPYESESVYDKGPLLFISRQRDGTLAASFLLRLPAMVGSFAFPAVLIGAWWSLVRSTKRPRNKSAAAATPLAPARPGALGAFFGDGHRVRCQWLIALIPIGVLLTHSYLWWRGRMASNGELRYMLVVSPFWGLLAAKGWEWVFSRCRLQSAVGWAGIAALVPAFSNSFYKVIPLQPTKESIRAEQAAKWYGQYEGRAAYPKLIATHREINFYLDISPTDWDKCAEWKTETVLNPPGGVLLIWDPIYGQYNSDKNLTMTAERIRQAGWVQVHSFEGEANAADPNSMMTRLARNFVFDDIGPWYVFLSPADKDGRPTPRPQTQAVR